MLISSFWGLKLQTGAGKYDSTKMHLTSEKCSENLRETGERGCKAIALRRGCLKGLEFVGISGGRTRNL